MFQDLMQDNQEEALSHISHNFESAQSLLKAMATEGLPLPRLYRALGEITLNRRLVELLRKLEPEPDQVATSQDILELVQEAELLGLKLESGEGARILGRILRRHLDDQAAGFQLENVSRLHQFLNLVGRMPITLDLTEAQNFMFNLMKEHFPEVAARAAKDPKADSPGPAVSGTDGGPLLQSGALSAAVGIGDGGAAVPAAQVKAGTEARRHHYRRRGDPRGRPI